VFEVRHEIIIIVTDFGVSHVVDVYVSHMYWNTSRDGPISTGVRDIYLSVIVIIDIVIPVVNVPRVFAMMNHYMVLTSVAMIMGVNSSRRCVVMVMFGVAVDWLSIIPVVILIFVLIVVPVRAMVMTAVLIMPVSVAISPAIASTLCGSLK
jgi:hypothetical protein